MFSTSKSWTNLTLTFVWPLWTFTVRLSCEHDKSSAVACITLNLYRDTLRIKISNIFEVELCLNFLTFWTTSCSNGSILQLLQIMIMPQNLLSSCCNFIGSNVLLVRISAKFDVELCVTFLNFQYNPKSNDLVNAITPQKLHVPCCNFTGIFSHQNFCQFLCWSLCNLFELSV